MSYVIQRVDGRNLTLTQVRGGTLRIGRGTNAELRSENPAVALEHAVIERDAHGFFITDKGSITGTYVNRKPVETARMAKGDVVEIGDLRIEVQVAELGKPLFLRVLETRDLGSGATADEEQGIVTPRAAAGAGVVRAKRFDYAGAYRLHRPFFTKLSLTALLLIVSFVVVGEVIRPERQTVFMPGGLSSAHSRARDARGQTVADRCDACHEPFRNVLDAKCRDCHPQAPHATSEASAPNCFACHAEHRGAPKLAAVADQQCASCHANLKAHVREGIQLAANRERIDAFGVQHPELAFPRDENTLRFNHKLHLNTRGIFNAQGKREVLECRNCHDLVEVKGKADPVKVSFAAHCQRCHRLTFDARYPNAEVPHGGDPGLVYGFVLATYAGDRDILGRAPAEVRRILSRRAETAPSRQAVLNADQVLKTKCSQCHDIDRRGARLAVRPPVIRTDWLARAKFTHGRHRNVACEQCHANARQSSATGDLLMPKLSECTSCHARDARVTQAASTCVTCHEYHQSTRQGPTVVAASLAPVAGTLGSGGRMLQGVLLAASIVLLLVLLIPIGLALYQRMKPAPPERSSAAGARPAAPPAPMPELRTDKVPIAPAPVEPTPVAPPPVAPVGESTQIASGTMMTMLPEEGGMAGGTMIVQWYGSLLCTSGPGEGQRRIIDDDGFYIGRDSTLSQVVIADSRISKRHVRIVPRDGRVWAIDQSSTNGTFIGKAGGQRITERKLERGDILVLADNVATFVYQV